MWIDVNLLKPTFLERLQIVVVQFHDIGGWLFPDHPNLETKPQQEVLELVRIMIKLWGHKTAFVAANMSSQVDYVKDMRLLKKYKVLEYVGIPQTDSVSYEINEPHVIMCNGPDKKGPAMMQILSQHRNATAHGIMCDNRLLVAKHMPADTHSIIYKAKDVSDPQICTWYNELKVSGETRIDEVDTIDEAAKKIVQHHLRIINKHLNKTNLKTSEIFEFQKQEEERVVDLFKTILPTKELHNIIEK